MQIYAFQINKKRVSDVLPEINIFYQKPLSESQTNRHQYFFQKNERYNFGHFKNCFDQWFVSGITYE